MTQRRTTIDVDGIAHGGPIPTGARIDNLIWSSAIQGMDPETGIVPDDGHEQIRLCFSNLKTFLRDAGVTPDDVIRLTVYLEDRSLRAAANEPWLELFPDEHNRPARHTMNVELNENMLIQLEVVAVAPS